MSSLSASYQRDRQLEALHQSAANLTQYACIVSARHIKDGVLRGQFNRDMDRWRDGYQIVQWVAVVAAAIHGVALGFATLSKRKNDW